MRTAKEKPCCQTHRASTGCTSPSRFLPFAWCRLKLVGDQGATRARAKRTRRRFLSWLVVRHTRCSSPRTTAPPSPAPLTPSLRFGFSQLGAVSSLCQPERPRWIGNQTQVCICHVCVARLIAASEGLTSTSQARSLHGSFSSTVSSRLTLLFVIRLMSRELGCHYTCL